MIITSHRTYRLVLFLGLLSLGLWSCGEDKGTEGPVRIAVASSLAPLFDRIQADGVQVEGRDMEIVRGSSGMLAGQIREGAPFDVFISADEAYFQSLKADDLIQGPVRSLFSAELVLLVKGDLPRSADSAVSGRHALVVPNPRTAPVGAAALRIIRALRKDSPDPRLIEARNAEEVASLMQSQRSAYAFTTRSVAYAANWPDSDLIPLPADLSRGITYYAAGIRSGSLREPGMDALISVLLSDTYSGFRDDHGYGSVNIPELREGAAHSSDEKHADPGITGPLWVSLKLALVTTFILLLIGLPLAWWLRVSHSPLRLPVDMLTTLPIVLPPTVLGFYLLMLLSPTHAPGSWLHDAFGLQLVFSFPGLVIGSVIFSLPFMVQALKTGMELLDSRMIDAAHTLGKGRWSIFRYVVLPNIRPAIFTGCILSFAHTLGEFGVVVMLGGNVSGETRTASVAIFEAYEMMDYTRAGQFAAVLLGLALLLLAALHIWRIRERRES